MSIDDRFYMELALKEAWRYQGLTYPNPAVGCAVVKEGRLLAVEAHRRAGESHAEVRALMAAVEALTGRRAPVSWEDADAAHDYLLSQPEHLFGGMSLYVTLEPCVHSGRTPSCARLLSRLPLHRVVVAHPDPVAEHAGGMDMIAENGIEVAEGICREEAADLIEPFRIWRERAFVLFKLAQTLNGRIGGGYLSCSESLEHVHRLRAVATEMIIGGGTVRSDRPRLDCRFTGDRAPDLTIFSREKEFDRSIPLFEVPDRRVEIRDDLSPLLERPGLLLVEGGEGMLTAMRERIDWMLHYCTPKLSSHSLDYALDAQLEFLHSEAIGVDRMLWSRFRAS
ncbi:bifunctional diaminohydroxyphosphoribosylaminopyrimidine deaminase/5-amino-6-(5-phosphoribosylamino)uracil reductase RibD [Nitratifractor sp.]